MLQQCNVAHTSSGVALSVKHIHGYDAIHIPLDFCCKHFRVVIGLRGNMQKWEIGKLKERQCLGSCFSLTNTRPLMPTIMSRNDTNSPGTADFLPSSFSTISYPVVAGELGRTENTRKPYGSASGAWHSFSDSDVVFPIVVGSFRFQGSATSTRAPSNEVLGIESGCCKPQ